MAKTSSLILLLSLSCFLSIALCRTINDPAAVDKSNINSSDDDVEKFNSLDISPATDNAAAGIEQSNPRWWFRRRFRPRLPWPLVHPPIPAAGGFTWPPNRPWPHWEYVSPPRPAGGFRWPPNDSWPRWHFVNPPMPARSGFTWPPNRPWPHWEFVQPPVAAGSHWPPREWPHWHFVQPPMPSGGGSNPPAEKTAATPAA